MFRDSFKYYKSKNQFPNLCNVLDFNNIEDSALVNRVFLNINSSIGEGPFGLQPISTWETFEIRACPGLIFIKNPFSLFGQRCWIVKCLQKYSQNLNKRNIDSLKVLGDNQDWWTESQLNVDIRQKLRWATLGYHHNWDTKVYSEDEKGEFPKDLKYLTEYIASALGYSKFSAEAAIVNFYHMDSTLSGHTDHSEQNLEAPLFSFSFGQTAIFLLGGKTKDEVPVPMYLRSGDIIVMSKESRLAYHGVPRIIPADSEPWNNGDLEAIPNIRNNILDSAEIVTCRNQSLWRPFSEYVATSRININVRQVLNNSCETFS